MAITADITLDSILKLPALKKILILIGIGLLFFVAYYYVMYLPGQEKIRQLQSKRDQLRVELTEKQGLVKNLARFQKEVDGLSDNLFRELAKLPDKKEIPEVLSSIAKIGKSTGLDFLIFKPGAVVQKDLYLEIPIQIEVKGSFHSVASFFDKISKLPRIVNITQVNMQAPTTKNGRVLLTTSCLATTFQFKKEQQKK